MVKKVHVYVFLYGSEIIRFYSPKSCRLIFFLPETKPSFKNFRATINLGVEDHKITSDNQIPTTCDDINVICERDVDDTIKATR